jgi:hypothetical protein
MELWFKRYTPDSAFHEKLISWWTKGEFTHVELVFDNDDSFSAEPFQGTRFIKDFRAKTYGKIPLGVDVNKKWKIVDLNGIINDALATMFWDREDLDAFVLEENLEKKVIEWCETQVGKPYDWKAVLGYVGGEHNFEDRSKWYCSEVTTYVLARFGLWHDKAIPRITPSEMHDELVGVEKFHLDRLGEKLDEDEAKLV